MPTVAEIVTFTLLAGSDPTAFIEAARATDTIVQAQPGFVSRHLSQGPDGRWTDYVVWADLNAAEAAAQAVMTAPAFAVFSGMIDPEDVQMRHENIEAVFD